jgi:hypothetical protein
VAQTDCGKRPLTKSNAIKCEEEAMTTLFGRNYVEWPHLVQICRKGVQRFEVAIDIQPN